MAQHSSWIRLSPNMKGAATIINQIESNKFQLFLNRIILELKQNPKSWTAFTEEEKEKLEKTLLITKDNLNILINSSILILLQAVYHITKPESLRTILIEDLKLDEDKANAFFNVWSNSAKNLILKLKQKSVYSTQLDDISWLVNIEITSQNNIQTFIPKATLQLKLKEESSSSNLDLDLNEKDLYYMYNTLENIQTALDSLT